MARPPSGKAPAAAPAASVSAADDDASRRDENFRDDDAADATAGALPPGRRRRRRSERPRPLSPRRRASSSSSLRFLPLSLVVVVVVVVVVLVSTSRSTLPFRSAAAASVVVGGDEEETEGDDDVAADDSTTPTPAAGSNFTTTTAERRPSKESSTASTTPRRRTTTTTTADYSEPYSETREYTDLWNAVSSSKWDEARKRLKLSPREASILVLKREYGARGGKVLKRSTPLHEAFAVDAGSTARGGGKRGEAMDESRSELIVDLISAHPAATNVTDDQGRLPLHVASMSSCSVPPYVTEALLDAHPDAAAATDDEGKIPLHRAVDSPMSDVGFVGALLEVYPDGARTKDRHGFLPVHVASFSGAPPSSSSSDANDDEDGGPDESVSILKLLLDAYPQSIREKDADGDVPLTIMARYGRTSLSAVRYVLDRDPGGLAEVRGAGGNTALHSAVATTGGEGGTLSSMDLAPLFLSLRPELATIANRGGRLPLHSSFWRYRTPSDLMEMLLDAHPEAAETKDVTLGALPLHYACREGVSDARGVLRLLELYPDGASTTTKEGRLPLHYALNSYSSYRKKKKKGQRTEPIDEVILKLLDLYPQAAKAMDRPDPRRKDREEWPLHSALKKDRPAAIIAALAKACPEAVAAKNDETQNGTAYHALAEKSEAYRNATDVELIVNAFEAAHPSGASELDDDGRSPLHVACLERNRDPESDGKRVLAERLLASHPDGAASKDDEGDLPLHAASVSRDPNLVKLLLEAHPDGAKTKGAKKVLPLHLACSSSRHYDSGEGGTSRSDEARQKDETVLSLLESRPDAAKVPDRWGSLPLHEAVSCVRVCLSSSAVEKLIDANPSAARKKDKRGNLPLHLAASSVGRRVGDDDDNASGRDDDNALSSSPPVDVIRSLLDQYPPASSVKDKRGSLPLHTVLTNADGKSAWRRSRDYCLRELDASVALLEAHPAGSAAPDREGRTPVHLASRIAGDMVGRTTSGWSEFLLRMVADRPEALAMKTARGNGSLPFHVLISHAIEMATTIVPGKGKILDVPDGQFERIVSTMLRLRPESVEETDEYGRTPEIIVAGEKLKKIRPKGFGDDEVGIVTFLERAVRRGKEYWIAYAELEAARRALESEGDVCGAAGGDDDDDDNGGGGATTNRDDDGEEEGGHGSSCREKGAAAAVVAELTERLEALAADGDGDGGGGSREAPTEPRSSTNGGPKDGTTTDDDDDAKRPSESSPSSDEDHRGVDVDADLDDDDETNGAERRAIQSDEL